MAGKGGNFSAGIAVRSALYGTWICCLWITDLSKAALLWLPMSWGIQLALLQIICRIRTTCHCWAIVWTGRELQLEQAGLDFTCVWECLQAWTLFDMRTLTPRWCGMIMIVPWRVSAHAAGLGWLKANTISSRRRQMLEGVSLCEFYTGGMN